MTELTSLRIDKWLWAARFYKTRQLANDAVAGGKIHLNGQRTKPSKEIKVGDNILIHIDQYAWDITVTKLNHQRRPAEEAKLLYAETPKSHEQRQLAVALQKEQNALLGYPQASHKPNKKERRLIHRFVQQHN